MTDLDNLDSPDKDLEDLEDMAPCHIHKPGELRKTIHDFEEYELMKQESGLNDYE